MEMWNYAFNVPDAKKVRMLVYTDCKNEADDQFTLAHHLMTPKIMVKGIIGAHFMISPQEWGPGNTAQASVDEINKVLSLMGLDDHYPVAKGAEYPLKDENTPNPSEGAKMIVEEAMKEDDRPLFIACQGSITDLASAILIEPRICLRLTAIWIGGGAYPTGGWEFNLANDVTAANVIMKSTMSLWQVPINVYKQMTVSLAELQHRVRPYGKIGAYLFDQMAAYNEKGFPNWPHGESWILGDQPTVGVLLENNEKTYIYDVVAAPSFDYVSMKYKYGASSRTIRVYNQVDVRLIMEDFYAKLAVNFPQV
jgi:purine nucleosidase